MNTLLLPFFPALVCVFGLALYVMGRPGDVKDIGKIMFAAGLLATLMLAGSTLLAVKL
jgi:hypothetical protein